MAKNGNKTMILLFLILLFLGGFSIWLMFFGGSEFLSIGTTGANGNGNGGGGGSGTSCVGSYPNCDGSCGSDEWCIKTDFQSCECIDNYPSSDCDVICSNQPANYDGGYKAHSGKDCDAGTFYEDGCCCYFDEDYGDDNGENGNGGAPIICGCVGDNDCTGECEEYPGYTDCYEYYWFDASYSACVCVMSGASSPLWYPGTENHHINEPLCRTKCAYAGYQNGQPLEAWCENDPDWITLGDCCCYPDSILKIHMCPNYQYSVRGVTWFGDLDCERYADEFCEYYHGSTYSSLWSNEPTAECCFTC